MKHAEMRISHRGSRRTWDMDAECIQKDVFLIGKLSLIKNIYKKFTTDIIINGETLVAFPPRSGTSPRISPFTTLFQYHWMSQ